MAPRIRTFKSAATKDWSAWPPLRAFLHSVLLERLRRNPESIRLISDAMRRGDFSLTGKIAAAPEARNQAPLLRLRGEILRSQPESAGLFALRRRGRAEAGQARRPGGARTPGLARSRACRSRRAADAGRARMVARTGRGDRQGRTLAQSGRAAGLPPVRLCRRRQDDARAPYRGGLAAAARLSPPSPARRRSSCAPMAAPARRPFIRSSTGRAKAPRASRPSP